MRSRKAPLQGTSLAATAAEASAALLRELQHHKLHGTKRISLPSTGVHTTAAQPAPMQPLSAILGHSAALGICKCLPYELPSLANEPFDQDPASTEAMSSSVAGAEQGDMYGVATSSNTLRRPLMLYRSSPAAGLGAVTSAQSSAYIITGKHFCYLPIHPL